MRVVVTRAAHQAEELAEPLRARGAEVLLVPVIGIAGPSDPRPLREAARECDSYDWIIFTSANAVTALAAALPEAKPPCKARVAAIGSTTAESAMRSGFPVAVVPSEYVAESLVEAMGAEQVSGQRILIPGAALRRDVVPRALCERGAHVDVIEAYRNVVPPNAAEQVAGVFREPWPDWVTFASSSAVQNTVALAGHEALRRMKIATIGPVTSATVRQHDLSIAAEANPHTVEGLVAAMFRE